MGFLLLKSPANQIAYAHSPTFADNFQTRESRSSALLFTCSPSGIFDVMQIDRQTTRRTAKWITALKGVYSTGCFCSPQLAALMLIRVKRVYSTMISCEMGGAEGREIQGVCSRAQVRGSGIPGCGGSEGGEVLGFTGKGESGLGQFVVLWSIALEGCESNPFHSFPESHHRRHYQSINHDLRYDDMLNLLS